MFNILIFTKNVTLIVWLCNTIVQICCVFCHSSAAYMRHYCFCWFTYFTCAKVDSENRTEETFQCLLERCIRTAVKMRTLGVTKDDIIAICSCNSLDCCVPLVAALFLGAKVSCFNSKLNLSFITHVIQLTDPKLIFVDADAIETISSKYKNIYQVH